MQKSQFLIMSRIPFKKKKSKTSRKGGKYDQSQRKQSIKRGNS